jgi:tetratricopeptide (TPR) repeat protein
MAEVLGVDRRPPIDRDMLSPFQLRGGADGSETAESPVWESEEEDLLGPDADDAGEVGEGFPRKRSAVPIGGPVPEAEPASSPERRRWHEVGRKRMEAEALEQEVLNLDSKYREFVRQGRLVDASDHLEKSLFARVKMFGTDSCEVERAARALVTHYNTAGMMALQAGNFKLSFQLLRKADVLTGKNGPLYASESRKRLRAVSLNNMGCFYRRRKKLHASLRNLEQALEIELNIQGPPIAPAGTHLNICAVLSELKHHEAALVHANAALSLLLPLFGAASRSQDPSIFAEQGLAELAAELRAAGARTETGDVDDSFSSAAAGGGEYGSGPSMLVAAYHNAAAQLEALKDLSSAAVTYQRAAACALRVWGSENVKCLVMQRAAKECRAKFLVKNPTAPDPFGQVMIMSRIECCSLHCSW